MKLQEGKGLVIPLPLAWAIAVGLVSGTATVVGFGISMSTGIERNTTSTENNRLAIDDVTTAIQKLPKLIREEMSDGFTDISTERGMYVIEGRPRLTKLEIELEGLKLKVQELSLRVARAESELQKKNK